MAIKKSRIIAMLWVAGKIVVLLHFYFKWRAKDVSPAAVVQATVPINNTDVTVSMVTAIPGIIHQSWKTTSIPKEFKQWSDSWKTLNPSYEHKLWTDQDNYNLIKEFYPWFLATYESYKKPIMRADSVRVFYLHKYGGIYSDLDVIPLKPIDKLLDGKDLVLARMNVPPLDEKDPDTNWYYVNQIPNAWMASKPGHPFWMHAAKLMMSLAQEKRDMPVEEKTGPIVIYRAYYEYSELQKDANGKDQFSSITLADPQSIFPYSWTPVSSKELHMICSQQSPQFDQVACLKAVDPEHKSFAISYWSHTWDKKRSRYLFWRLLGY
ncbi:nucleotide-diphospho-sugar transferase [Obelidium mucronatum]|nr:nucleotide-diphospho-sugar transferase [Obelidium mucronatum]